MKMTAKFLAVIIFVVLFGGIAVTTALGWWETKTTKEPVKFAAGEAAGQYNPADIRGSYLFGDISRLFGIPLEDLAAAFNVPKGGDPAQFSIKSLESQYAESPVEIGTDSIRLFVAFYKGLPFDLSGEAYLPEPAAAILRQKATLSSERLAYLDGHTLSSAGNASPTVQAAATALPAAEATPNRGVDATAQAGDRGEEYAQPERTITGKTTFQDLLDWGAPRAAIEQVLGEILPDPSTIIKDYYLGKGAEFGEGKAALQALIDATK